MGTQPSTMDHAGHGIGMNAGYDMGVHAGNSMSGHDGHDMGGMDIHRIFQPRWAPTRRIRRRTGCPTVPCL